MWTRALLGVVLAMLLPATISLADLRHSGDRPTFTADEYATIQRNRALVALVDHDPWLVRRVLDAIAAAETTSESKLDARSEGRTTVVRERAPDPARNPDLEQLGRASPEAAHDLFQLIKKASSGSKKGGSR